MDPNTCLDCILIAARDLIGGRIARIGVDDDDIVDYDQHAQLRDTAEQLAESILNLDEWIRRGGFLPLPWTQTVKVKKKQRKEGKL